MRGECAPARASVSPAVCKTVADGCGGASPPRRTITAFSSRPRGPLARASVCRAVPGGFDSRRGRQFLKHQDRLTVGPVVLTHEMRVRVLPLVPNHIKPDLAKWEGGGLQSRHDRVRFAGSGPNQSWSSSEGKSGTLKTCRRRLETVLRRHSRVAQRLEQLVYTQTIGGSIPSLGNHTLVAEQVGSRLLIGFIEVRVLARVPSGDSRARSKARGLDPRDRRFESSSPDHTPV